LNNPEIVIEKLADMHIEGCYELIKELALYEKAPEEVALTLAQFREDAKTQKFEAWVACKGNLVVGMALYYHIYSTWKGASIHLEDLIVQPNFRRLGIGRLLFEKTMDTARSCGAGRMQWQVLDWNEPAIAFYKKYPAQFDGEWINVKISKEDLRNKPQ